MPRPKKLAFRYEFYDLLYWGDREEANDKLTKFLRKSNKGFMWFIRDCFEKDKVAFVFDEKEKTVSRLVNEAVALESVFTLWKEICPEQEDACKKAFMRTIDHTQQKESKRMNTIFLLVASGIVISLIVLANLV